MILIKIRECYSSFHRFKRGKHSDECHLFICSVKHESFENFSRWWLIHYKRNLMGFFAPGFSICYFYATWTCVLERNENKILKKGEFQTFFNVKIEKFCLDFCELNSIIVQIEFFPLNFESRISIRPTFEPMTI